MKGMSLLISVMFVSLLCGCGEKTPEGSGPANPLAGQMDPELRDEMFAAVWDDNVPRVRALLEAYPTLANAQDNDGTWILMEALDAGSDELAPLLIEKGARLDVVCSWDNSTMLHRAASAGRTEIVKQVLDAGVDPARRDAYGETALMGASSSCSVETVRLLLKRSNPSDEELDSAILLAALAVPPLKDCEWMVDRNAEHPLGPRQELKIRQVQDAARRTSESIVSLLRSRRKDPDAPYTFWRAATGVGPDRMNLHKGKGFMSTVHSTIWKHGDEEFLVRFQYPGIELFGTPSDVVVLDKTPKIVRFGGMTMQQDYFPYALVEVYSESKNHPVALRGKWTLGVACLQWPEDGDTCDKALDLTKPLVLQGWGYPPDNKANYIDAELIQWEDGPKMKYGTGNLSELEDMKFRWAETGPNIFDRMMNRIH